MPLILRVRPIERESTRFHVEARHLNCKNLECKWATKAKKWKAGNPCPKCGQPLEHGEYLVDLMNYNSAGQCGCKNWEIHVRPVLEKMNPTERMQADVPRCPHIYAALEFYARARIIMEARKELPTAAAKRSNRFYNGQ